MSFGLDYEGTLLLDQISKRLLGQPIGIFYFNDFVRAPILLDVLESGVGVIQGLPLQDAKQLAELLNAGQIIVPLSIVERHGF